MTVHLELLERKDIEWLRGLRNRFRGYFFDTKPISRSQQEEWYIRYSETVGYFVFIIWLGKRPIGSVSIKRVHNDPLAYEVGNLMILPSQMGNGYMTESMEWIMAQIPNCFWVAHVKPTNTASLRLFKRAGFWRVPRAR